MGHIKVGMIGASSPRSERLIRTLQNFSGAQLAGVADVCQSRGEMLARQYGVICYQHPQELLMLEEVSAVVMCSGQVFPKKLVQEAASAGKHILLELPGLTSQAELQEAMHACDTAGVKLMMMFPYRFHPAVQSLKDSIRRGDLGDVLAVKTVNRTKVPKEWGRDEAPSGRGLAGLIQLADLIGWMAGSKVRDVYAEAVTGLPSHPAEEAAIFHLIFENGLMAAVETGGLLPQSYPAAESFTMEWTGTEGVLSLDGFAQKQVIYSDTESRVRWEVWGDGMDEGMIGAFLDSIKHASTVPISGRDGRQAVLAAQAAYESIIQRMPVRLGSHETFDDIH